VSLAIPAAGDRAALADVVGRVVRLDPTAVVRLRDTGRRVVLWAGTPFEVLVTTEAPGSVTPGDVTVAGSDLLAALSVVDAPEVDPGSAVDDRWRGDLPGVGPWRSVGAIPASEVDAVVARSGASSLDDTAWEGGGVRVPARCLVAVAGMGWPEDTATLPVAVSGDEGWLRVEVGGASIVRRRRPRLAVLV
jgi:hypothetical protein